MVATTFNNPSVLDLGEANIIAFHPQRLPEGARRSHGLSSSSFSSTIQTLGKGT